MIEITDQEAIDWPLDAHRCSECGIETHFVCGPCGETLCLALSCIKAHAAKGCYNPRSHADHSPTHVNQNPSPNAGPSDHAASTLAEPAVDAEAVEQPSVPKGR